MTQFVYPTEKTLHQLKLQEINTAIDNNFFTDYHNWILWVPIIFACGILFYFEFKYSNTYTFCYTIGGILALMAIAISKRSKTYLMMLIACLVFAVGYVRVCRYYEKLDAPTIREKTPPVKIYGTITDLSYYQKNNVAKKRIIMAVKMIRGFAPRDTPKFVRININNKKYQPKFGDVVVVRTNLTPIPHRTLFGAENLRLGFYFQQIGGIGYNGYVETHRNGESSLRNKAYNIREEINNRIISVLGERTGAVVGSFITGIRGRITTEDMDNMTYSGLVHIIAISGMNMSIVMGLFFAFIRRILVMSTFLTLRYDIKKISALFAIIVGFLYLSITGFPVSANRAFIMGSLFFVSILIERECDLMRFLCVTAMMILYDEPNLVLNPSFQLSFLAVLGLIRGFGLLKEYNLIPHTKNIIFRFVVFLYEVLISTIIAEISVSPLTIYYFNTYTPYNILANLIAIPLTSFITIPFSTFAILLFPFHLEKYLLIPSGWAIDIVLEMSKYFTSVWTIPSPSALSLILMLFGFFWFTLWEQKWRYLGVVLYSLGILCAIFTTVPDVVIDTEDKIVAIVKDKTIYFSNNRNNYKTKIIMKKLGVSKRDKLSYDNTDDIFTNKNVTENFKKFEAQHNIFTKKHYHILVN